VAGERGTLVAFICNHCPYVLAVIDRLVRDARELAPLGIGVVAISANDAISYPDDSFPNMKAFAAHHGLPFPYLYDESQAVARAYGAVCTPDFFGFDAGLKLAYRGRLDASRNAPAPAGARRELFEAMRLIAETGAGPAEQFPAVGCSIKWRAA
jgi:thiol-disulfide isomerase/thioredoxin